MAEQVGKFLTELPELETPTDGDLMYIVDDETTSKKVTMANLKRVLGGNVTGTVEGASVSFSDGADGIPMEECEVTIVPSQDLHGYSKPWAGGAGKNKLPITATSQTVQGVTFTVNSNGTISLSGTATGRADFVLSTFNAYGGNYTISGAPQNGSAKWNLRIDLTSSGETNQCYDDGTSTSSPTMNTSQGTQIKAVIRVYQGINTNGLIFKPMLEQGSSATTFEPYSNICPISGHTDITVTVASTSGGSGDDTTVSLGRTVYGGSLDVNTGELTDGDGTPQLFNSANTNVWSGTATSTQGVTRFYTTPSYAGRELVMSDTYEISPNYATETDIITMSVDGRIIITPTFGQGKTLNEFKALLADNPFNVLMTLATPQTFNLTPTQVKTLLGQNYVSHDGGGNIKVVYIRDLDIVINDLINRVTALENE